jgi:hypothetical protein
MKAFGTLLQVQNKIRAYGELCFFKFPHRAIYRVGVAMDEEGAQWTASMRSAHWAKGPVTYVCFVLTQF